MSKNVIYILLMAMTTYVIRALPLTLIRKKIENPFIQSFLYYVPYVTLAVMIFPAIIYATNNIISGSIALIVGIIIAYFGGSLPKVASVCCIIVFVLELFI